MSRILDFHFQGIHGIDTEQIKQLVIALERSNAWIGKFIADNRAPEYLTARAREQLESNLNLLSDLKGV